MTRARKQRKTLGSLVLKLRRYVTTIYFLKITQIFYQILYRLLPQPSLRNASIYKPVKIDKINWPSYLSISSTDGQVFKFLGIEGDLNDGWEQDNKSRLWSYNLHYLPDLAVFSSAISDRKKESLLQQWLQQCSSPSGIGWESYPISLRLVNILKFCSNSKNLKLSEELCKSLGMQVEYLFHRLEYHILGNHLFVNAKALIFYGLLSESERASEKYLRKGIAIIERELSEQFLEDGGHFELSTMYQALLLWDVLDLIYLINIEQRLSLQNVKKQLSKIAIKGLNWLSVMSHPDGEISFFNDAAFDIAPNIKELLAYADQCGLNVPTLKPQTLVTLSDSGYSRIEQHCHSLLFDHGSIGPDYLPGHAHADSLCFEWSVKDQRVLVNSGTSVYEAGKLRAFQRSTRAHNTVEVNHLSSSDVWGAFRVADRARTTLIKRDLDGESVTLQARHDGYQNLIHDRMIRSTPDSIKIIDSLLGQFETATAIFYLHPAIQIVKKETNKIVLEVAEGQKILVTSSGTIEIKDATWFPIFGESHANKALLMNFETETVNTQFTLLG